MTKTKALLTLSNGESLTINHDTVINVYNGEHGDVEHPYASGGRHFTLESLEHPDAGFAVPLMGIITGWDFFSLGREYDIDKVFYKSSSVVSISHLK